MTDAIDQFAAEASRFESWAHRSDLHGEVAAREALIRVSSLYTAALQLPPAWSDALEDEPDVLRLPADECQRLTAIKHLPIDMYGVVGNPLLLPPDDPGIGSVVDDLSDIYRDVVTGLRAYRAGNRAQAVWECAFGFTHHWGEHATGAIQAIHAWLAANAPERLTTGPNTSNGRQGP